MDNVNPTEIDTPGYLYPHLSNLVGPLNPQPEASIPPLPPVSCWHLAPIGVPRIGPKGCKRTSHREQAGPCPIVRTAEAGLGNFRHDAAEAS